MSWLTFEDDTPPQITLTKQYNVVSKSSGDILGRIKWYPRWRQYTFCPANDTVFTHDCMKDISEFVLKLQSEQNEIIKSHSRAQE